MRRQHTASRLTTVASAAHHTARHLIEELESRVFLSTAEPVMGHIISREPIGSGSASASVVNGVVYSQLNSGTSSGPTDVTGGVVGTDDYDSVNNANINLTELRFIGGVQTPGTLEFEFLNTSQVQVTEFQVTFDAGDVGDFLWTIGPISGITIPDAGYMRIRSQPGVTGTWFFSNAAPTIGTQGDAAADTAPAGHSYMFELTNTSPNTPPSITSLSDSPDPAGPGVNVTLTANGVTDSEANVSDVKFYRETNAVAGLQVGGGGDLLLATDTTASPYSHTFSTTGLAHGTYTYYAQATDTTALTSNVVSTTHTVNTGSISGTVWNDVNNNSLFDAGESGLSGWTVFLDNNDNQALDAGETSIVTGAGGTYSFTALAAGTYFVNTVLQAGWQQSFPGVGGQINSITTSAAGTKAAGVSVQSVPAITTEGSDATVRMIDDAATGGPSGVGTRDLESNPLIRLTNFQADPRFSTIRGQGHAVAVIDTGIDRDHPFFGPDANADGRADRIVYEWDYVNNDNNASDDNGHGTNVASIVGSQGATAPGMAPNVNLVIFKVLNAAGSGNFAHTELALQWIVANHAAYNISSVNLSLGDSGNYNTNQSLYGLSDEIAALALANVMVIAAAGNSYFSFQTHGVSYPAADANALAVSASYDANVGGPINWASGATDNTTAPDRIASFSQRSSTKTAIFAPGPFSTGGNQTGGTNVQGGTSQAAPHIAGIAALAQQLALRDLGRRLTVTEFKTLMNTSGVLINDGDDENDNVTNTGANFRRVDVFALGEAIYAMAVNPYTHTVNLSPGEAQGGINFGVRNTAGGTGSIAGKMFEDYDGDGVLDAGEPGRAGVTVNLDLGNNGSIDATTTTSASGDYSFSALAAGSHTVTQVVPTDFICNLASINVILGAGQASTNNNFGEFRVTHVGTAGNDVYTLRRDVAGTRIEVVAGAITWSKLATQLASSTIAFNPGAGDDLLNVEYTNGAPLPTFGVTYNGGTHATATGDRLAITGTTAGETYQIFSNAVLRSTESDGPQYQNLEGITLNAQGGNDTITQIGTPNGTAVTIFGGGGDDAINLQSTGTTAAVTISGGTENDTITIGQGNLGFISSAVSVQGDANTDAVIVNDSTNPNPAAFTLNGANVSRSGFGGLVYGTSESLTLNTGTVGDTTTITGAAPSVPVTVNGGNGNDGLIVNVAPTAALVFNGGLNAAFTDVLNVNAGTFTFNANANVGTANLHVNVTDANVVFNAAQNLAALILNGTAVATMPANGNRYLFTRTLSISSTTKLNLTDNDLIVDYTGGSVEAQVRQWVKNGRTSGGANGIVTTPGSPDDDKVMAVADNAAWGKTIFSGVNIDGTTVIGKYTYFGDANLDGKVTGDDYLNVDANLGTGDSWLEGDFNMSGVTTGDDYLAIDANLGKGTVTPLAFADEQEAMIALHAEQYGGASYIKAVEQAMKGTYKIGRKATINGGRTR